jgi:alanine transaminase
MGECGLRGGYAEVINMCPQVKAMYLKAISAMLCPTVLGQATLDVVVNPPREGEPSYEQFIKEKKNVLASLKVCI